MTVSVELIAICIAYIDIKRLIMFIFFIRFTLANVSAPRFTSPLALQECLPGHLPFLCSQKHYAHIFSTTDLSKIAEADANVET